MSYRFVVTQDSVAREFRLQGNALRYLGSAIRSDDCDYHVLIHPSDTGAFSTFETADEAIARVKRFLQRRVPTHRAVVLSRLGTKIVQRTTVRAVEVAPPVPDLGCHPDIERIHAAVWDRFGDVRSGGIYVCRTVAGSTAVSRHGYVDEGWKGAAEDIFVSSPNTMEHLYEVGYFIVKESTERRLRASRVIVGDDMWTPGGWEHYSGEFHRHVHSEVLGGRPCT